MIGNLVFCVNSLISKLPNWWKMGSDLAEELTIWGPQDLQKSHSPSSVDFQPTDISNAKSVGQKFYKNSVKLVDFPLFN
jgi:hypothetical protein